MAARLRSVVLLLMALLILGADLTLPDRVLASDPPEPATSWKYPPDMPGSRIEIYKRVGDVSLNAYIFARFLSTIALRVVRTPGRRTALKMPNRRFVGREKMQNAWGSIRIELLPAVVQPADTSPRRLQPSRALNATPRTHRSAHPRMRWSCLTRQWR